MWKFSRTISPETLYRYGISDWLSEGNTPEPRPAAANSQAPYNTPVQITIIYQDDDLVVADKPEGVSAIEQRDPDDPSLLTLLEKQLNQKLWVVQALSTPVSGLNCFAKHDEAHKMLSQAFDDHHIKLDFRLLALGSPKADEGEIDAPIRPAGAGRMAVDLERGRPACTHWRVLHRAGPHALIQARSKTGLRHQLRAHFAHAGWPIAGDDRYGPVSADYPRLMLHAAELRFETPAGSTLHLQTPPPPSFLEVLDRLAHTR